MDGEIPFERSVLVAANINPLTGLATDYLNHYNEVAMMIASLEDMPDMAEAVLEWRPMGYAAHFRVTNFSDRDLAIAAYDAAPADVKARFLTVRRELELEIAEVQDLLEADPSVAASISKRGQGIFDGIARLGGVINGETRPLSGSPVQDAVDSLFP
jgi:hypothetical protein